MPVFYNYTENGVVYSFDDVFVPAHAFRQGNLWSWGSNSNGQLGINQAGSATSRSTPVTTISGGANWKSIYGSDYSVYGIKTDGTLWSWGSNSLGALGSNDAINARICTPITTFAGGTNWKQVSGGNGHAAAIKTDGTLWVWGLNSNGKLGTNDAITRYSPVTTFAGGTNWKQVSCGDNQIGAIKTDGTLWVWGNSSSSGGLGINDTIARSTPVTTFAGGNNWKQIAYSRGYAMAIKTDGTLWGWGSSTGLGINDTISRSTPVTTFAGGNNWKQVECGYGFISGAIKTDGTLWVWGSPSSGALGINAAATNRLTPITTFAGGTNWKQIDCGNDHMAAIKTDGTLWTWGSGASGELGNNSGISRSTPVTTFAGGTNWKQVSCGRGPTHAVTYIDDYI